MFIGEFHLYFFFFFWHNQTWKLWNSRLFNYIFHFSFVISICWLKSLFCCVARRYLRISMMIVYYYVDVSNDGMLTVLLITDVLWDYLILLLLNMSRAYLVITDHTHYQSSIYVQLTSPATVFTSCLVPFILLYTAKGQYTDDPRRIFPSSIQKKHTK